MSISGDGGFLYACGELAAAKQENIPLTAVIVDDGGYGMIRYDQDLHGDPREGVDLTNPDFVALAAAFGIRADSVDGLGEHFGVALKGHVALKEPTMLVARAAPRPAAERVAALVPAVTEGRRRTVAAAPGPPRRRAHPAAGRAHGAGRRGLARGPAHPPRAHHHVGSTDSPDLGGGVRGLADRHRAGGPRASPSSRRSRPS